MGNDVTHVQSETSCTKTKTNRRRKISLAYVSDWFGPVSHYSRDSMSFCVWSIFGSVVSFIGCWTLKTLVVIVLLSLSSRRWKIVNASTQLTFIWATKPKAPMVFNGSLVVWWDFSLKALQTTWMCNFMKFSGTNP